MIHQAAKNPWNWEGSHNPKPSCVVSSYCITVLDTHTHTYIYIYITYQFDVFDSSIRACSHQFPGMLILMRCITGPGSDVRKFLVKSAMPWRTHCLFLCALPPVIVNCGQVRSAVFLLIIYVCWLVPHWRNGTKCKTGRFCLHHHTSQIWIKHMFGGCHYTCESSFGLKSCDSNSSKRLTMCVGVMYINNPKPLVSFH